MTSDNKNVKVRFAPSPTGFLHVGGLRTALYNYLFAKQQGGQFILRIEDTDKERYVAEAEENILDTLKTFGLEWDEGPIRQSENLDKYKTYAEQLVEKGLAYKDYTSSEQLDVLREKAKAENTAFKFTKDMAQTEGEGEYVIRFAIPENGSTKFTDIIRQEVEVKNEELEDFVILKSDGYPTYNFANVVDDHEMGITHVIRGEEFVPSTPKHILLYQALEWEAPQFAHLPLLLNKNRAKLSKREGDVAVRDFLNKGYLKETLLNFVALLGWHPSDSEKEIFTLDELLQEFKLEDVQKAGAIFDLDKLNWFQKTWAQRLSENQQDPGDHPLHKQIFTFFEQKFETVDQNLFDLLWSHILERAGDPKEYYQLPDEFDFFFTEPSYSGDILIWKKSDKESTVKALEDVKTFLQSLPTEKWSTDVLESEIKTFIATQGHETGTVLWPLRVALTGKEKSMGPFEILDIFNRTDNREVAFERIDQALNKLK